MGCTVEMHTRKNATFDSAAPDASYFASSAPGDDGDGDAGKSAAARPSALLVARTLTLRHFLLATTSSESDEPPAELASA